MSSDSETVAKSLNPWVFNLLKFELELKCPLCLNLLTKPVLLPCNHIFCQVCVPKSEQCKAECAACQHQFLDKEVRPASYMENIISIYKSLNSTFSSTIAPLLPTDIVYIQTGRIRMPNWLELPEGIFELIVNKLHFTDQIRALAVCKTWRESKDNVRCHDSLPWLISHQQVNEPHEDLSDTDDHSFICDLVDPYSGKLHEVSDSIQEQISYSLNNNENYNELFLLASKLGWVVFGGREYSSSFNPFTGDIYEVSSQNSKNAQATFRGSPASPDCEIFSLAIWCLELGIETSTRSSFKSKLIATMTGDELLYSVLYIEGNIIVFFRMVL